jgi:RNA polymerase sigma-70 factor (ECF subfamily)
VARLRYWLPVGAYGGESAIRPGASVGWARRRRSAQSRTAAAYPGEVELVERARSDGEAFGQLYERYAPLIYRFVHNRMRDPEVAEDVTSEVFYKALRAIDRYQQTGRPFRAWLYQIAVHTMADHLRRRRAVLDLDAAGDQPDRRPPVEDQVVQRTEIDRIWAAVATLNDAQRTAISLKLGQDMHTADVAALMGRSEAAVKLLVHRGVASVRAQLAEPAARSRTSLIES